MNISHGPVVVVSVSRVSTKHASRCFLCAHVHKFTHVRQKCEKRREEDPLDELEDDESTADTLAAEKKTLMKN